MHVNGEGQLIFAEISDNSQTALLPERYPPSCFSDHLDPRKVRDFNEFYDRVTSEQPLSFNANLHLDQNRQLLITIKASVTPDGGRIFLINRQDIYSSGCGEQCFKAASLEAQYEQNPGGILLVNNQLQMVSFNKEFVSIWGIPKDILDSRDDKASLDHVLAKVIDPEGFLKRVMDLYDNFEAVSTDEINLRDGRVLYRHTYPIFCKKEYLGRAWYFLDVTTLKKAKEDLRFMAYHDALTKLPNRRLFHDLLQHSVKRAKRNQQQLAVLFLDLDNFKSVNDSHGHDAGDQLLVTIAETLRSCLRDSDIICRWGGDEFVIGLLESCGSSSAGAVARKLCRTVLENISERDHRFQVSVSIGVAMHPEHGAEPDLLIRNADMAMYLAKRLGKNRCALYMPYLAN